MLPTINTPDRQAEAFPVLTPAQIARIRPHASVRSVQAGEVLFEPGKSGMSCFVVLTGKLDIAMAGLSGEQVFVTYGPGQFSGEVVLISGARALSRGRVAEPGEFLELSGDALRTLIAKDAELSDIFMRAFLLRRVAMISGGLGKSPCWDRSTRPIRCACANSLPVTAIPIAMLISIATKGRRNFWIAST